MREKNLPVSPWGREIMTRVLTFVPIKAVGTTAFMYAFFWLYFYLLKHPLQPVTILPLTFVDRWLAFVPQALPLYLSLWVYVSLPPALCKTWSDLLCHAAYVTVLCLSGLLVFLLWPTAVPMADPVWGGISIKMLRGIDAAGNACPSLHVATAVFSALWLNLLLREIGVPVWLRRLNWLWCIGIVYSTMAVRQHVLIDVAAGAVLGAGVGMLALQHRQRCLERPT